MSRKITEQEAREWLKKNRPEIELVEWGGSSNSRASKFLCKECGNEWTTTFASIKSGTGCRRCAFRKNGLRSRTTEAYVNEWLLIHEKPFTLKYWGGSACGNESTWYCFVCEKEWSAAFTDIKHGHGCPDCGHRRSGNLFRLSKDSVDAWFCSHPDIHIKCKSYCGKCTDHSIFCCLDCGEEWSASFTDIKHGRGCPVCAIKKRTEANTYQERYAIEWLATNRPHLSLIEYGGGFSKYSRLRCNNCGNEWSVRLVLMKCSNTDCPYCNPGGQARYFYDGVYFDSSWEIAFYMYWKFCKHKKLYRNPQKHGLGYCIPYGSGGSKEFHPDFITANHRLIEIKPENGGKDREHIAKRRASKKCGRKVYWYGYREINSMKEWLIKHSYDWEQYRVNDKKNKPKVKKQNKSDECEESCCGKA